VNNDQSAQGELWQILVNPAFQLLAPSVAASPFGGGNHLPAPNLHKFNLAIIHEKNPMSPQDIATAIASGDQEQIKKAQKFLKSIGKYEGPIDGDPGPGTLGAIKDYREEYREDRKLSVDEKKAEATEAANDPVNRAVGFAVDAVPAAGGYYLGSRIGKKTSESLDTAEKARGRGAKNLARASDLDPIEAEKTARKRGYFKGPRKTGPRGYALPAAAIGMGQYTRGPFAESYEDPIAQNTFKAIGSAETALGAGMGVKQLLGDVRRGNEVDSRDQAALRSRAAEARAQRPGVLSQMRGGAQSALEPPQQPPAQQPQPRSVPTNRTPQGALRGALQKISGARAIPPVAAGVLGYDAVTGDAQAGDGEVTNQDRAKGAAVGGAAAGTTYGVMRGIDKLGNTAVGRNIGRMMPGLTQGMAVHDLHSRAAEHGSDPVDQVTGLAGDVYDSFAGPIRSAPDTFESALQAFLSLLDEDEDGQPDPRANQLPRRPGPQL
jgi:peptidoglycan hydrolase-like protein with peptidoglycan-binding domain